MTAARLRRREFLASASVGVLALAACATTAPSASSALSADQVRTLERTARLIYPHAALNDAVYADVVVGIVAADAMRIETLADGATALDAAGQGRFVDRTEADQIAALRSIEASPFFTLLRGEVQTRLYEHPAVWAMLGYPGPSLTFGGYVDKGFDDIDWLPQSSLAEDA